MRITVMNNTEFLQVIYALSGYFLKDAYGKRKKAAAPSVKSEATAKSEHTPNPAVHADYSMSADVNQ